VDPAQKEKIRVWRKLKRFAGEPKIIVIHVLS
jgi:hypothetical protein